MDEKVNGQYEHILYVNTGDQYFMQLFWLPKDPMLCHVLLFAKHWLQMSCDKTDRQTIASIFKSIEIFNWNAVQCFVLINFIVISMETFVWIIDLWLQMFLPIIV